MKKDVKLVKKIKRLLKRLRCPRYLHRFGPKTYEFYQHMVALLIGHYCRLSYRRIVNFLDLIEIINCPSKSALQYTARKISNNLWNKMLEATSSIKHKIIALDGTGFSRRNPSYHYLRRIDGKLPKIPVKLSAAYDVSRKKFCTVKIRVLPAHDIKDAKSLMLRCRTKIVVADKAYDANWLHEYLSGRDIEAHIPIRNNGKVKHFNWSKRNLAAKNFKLRIYHKRELIESGFGSLKRKFGGSVNSKKSQTIKAELYGRLICHNLFYCFIET